NLLVGNRVGLERPAYVKDLDEMFFNQNNGDLEIEIDLSDCADLSRDSIVKVKLRVERATKQYMALFSHSEWEIRVDVSSGLEFHQTVFRQSGNAVADFNVLFEVCRALSNTIYLPAFRHITPYAPISGSVDASKGFYDMQVGKPF